MLKQTTKTGALLWTYGDFIQIVSDDEKLFGGEEASGADDVGGEGGAGEGGDTTSGDEKAACDEAAADAEATVDEVAAGVDEMRNESLTSNKDPGEEYEKVEATVCEDDDTAAAWSVAPEKRKVSFEDSSVHIFEEHEEDAADARIQRAHSGKDPRAKFRDRDFDTTVSAGSTPPVLSAHGTAQPGKRHRYMQASFRASLPVIAVGRVASNAMTAARQSNSMPASAPCVEVLCDGCGTLLDDAYGNVVCFSIGCCHARGTCERWTCYRCAGFATEAAAENITSNWFCKQHASKKRECGVELNELKGRLTVLVCAGMSAWLYST